MFLLSKPFYQDILSGLTYRYELLINRSEDKNSAVTSIDVPG